MKEKIKAVSFSLFFYYNLANGDSIEEVRWTHGMVQLVRLKYSRTDFHEGNLNGNVISCIWNFALLARDLLSPKLKVPLTIRYVNNVASTIYSH